VTDTSQIQVTEGQRQAVEEFRQRHRTGVLALLFTDLVDSTGLKERLGDSAGNELLQRHRAQVREVLGRFREAEEISTAGDSFFIVCVKPSNAVRLALEIQHAHRSFADARDAAVGLRIGIHMGEVFIEETGTRSTIDVLGLQVDTAARVMSLAEGGQILMTRSVFDNARTILRGEALERLGTLLWLNHGFYAAKGLIEPVEVCEVGEEGKAPLRAPAETATAQRRFAPDSEPVLGWRPALDQVVPGTEWALEKNLGEGAFGEVWLARHRRTREARVFKFCLRADRLRSLKREMTLFRVLKEVLGERPDIARLYDIQFETAPYYLVLEYASGGNLVDWIEERGGFESVPMPTRLEIVAQVAAALQAAHSADILHKDVKPSNVLIESRAPDHVQVRLTDFGIGQLTDRRTLERAGITATGLTEDGESASDSSGRAGTRIFMAPELLTGGRPSVQSDIYALGVLLYQLTVGDFSRPITIDWERPIQSPALQDVLRRCLAGDPAERYASADALAQNLRTIIRQRAYRPERPRRPATRLLLRIGLVALPLFYLIHPSRTYLLAFLACGVGVWAVRSRRTTNEVASLATWMALLLAATVLLRQQTGPSFLLLVVVFIGYLYVRRLWRSSSHSAPAVRPAGGSWERPVESVGSGGEDAGPPRR
jgi:serine/threonine-protein kinase